MSQILNIILFVILVAIGILSIKHYFDVKNTGEDTTFRFQQPGRYNHVNDIQFLKGKASTKYSWRYLIQGIIFLMIALYIFIR
jgi:hypothetical protein